MRVPFSKAHNKNNHRKKVIQELWCSCYCVCLPLLPTTNKLFTWNSLCWLPFDIMFSKQQLIMFGFSCLRRKISFRGSRISLWESFHACHHFCITWKNAPIHCAILEKNVPILNIIGKMPQNQKTQLSPHVCTHTRAKKDKYTPFIIKDSWCKIQKSRFKVQSLRFRIIGV